MTNTSTEVEEVLEKHEEKEHITNIAETEVGFRIDLDRSKVEEVEKLDVFEELEGLDNVEEVDSIVSGIIVILKE